MAKTNFAALEDHQKKTWSKTVWHQARAKSFLSRFVGTSTNSLIYRVTELTKTEKGTEAVVPLLADLTEDGVTGDNQLEGNEEAMKTSQDKIQIDQLRHAVRNTGRVADQKTVVGFRKNAQEQLSHWLADRIDQMGFLTLSGISYDQHNNGKARTGSNLPNLAFAADVTAPTEGRHLRVVAGGTVVDGDTAAIAANDTIGYDHIVQLQAIAKTRYLRGIRGDGGSETYHLFLPPLALARLKLDPDFKENARQAGVRGNDNTLWKGGESYVVDGVVIHEFRHVYTTLQAAAGSKWGADGNVNGARGLLCGAQALAMADLGLGYWDEEEFDYKNSYGVSYGKLFGFKKPVFKYAKESSAVDGKEDYGVIALDMAI